MRKASLPTDIRTAGAASLAAYSTGIAGVASSTAGEARFI